MVGIIAALVLVAASAFMNFEYVSSWGKDALNGQILGTVSVAFDIIKSLLPFFILWAWKNRRFFHVSIGTVLFVGLAGFSLLSALGFSASNRDFMTGNKISITAQFDELGEQIAASKQALNAQPQARAVGIVEQDINAKKQHKRFSSTKGCTDATQTKSRIFCKDYFALKGELAAARERARLSAKIEVLTRKRDHLRGQGATLQADPQAGLLAKLTGLKIENTQTALIVFIAVLVELAAAFGLYLATAHGGFAKKTVRKRARSTPRTSTPRTKSAPKAQPQAVRLVKSETKAIPAPAPKPKSAPVATPELCPLEELKRQNLQIVVSR
jgi:hypothetical protein